MTGLLAILLDLLGKAIGKAISDWAATLTRDAAQRELGERRAAERARQAAEEQERLAREAAARAEADDAIDPNDPFLRRDQ